MKAGSGRRPRAARYCLYLRYTARRGEAGCRVCPRRGFRWAARRSSRGDSGGPRWL